MQNNNTSSLLTMFEKNGKIGKNDKCYCGSQLKYKKCCMNKPSPIITSLIEHFNKLYGNTFYFLDVSKEIDNQIDYEHLQRKYWNNKNAIDGKKVICIVEKTRHNESIFENRVDKNHPILKNSNIIIFRSGFYRSFPYNYALENAINYGDFFEFETTEEMQDGVIKSAKKTGNTFQVGI